MDIIYRYDPHLPARSRESETADDAERSLAEGNRRYQEIVARVRAEVLGLGDGVADPVVIPSAPQSLGFSPVAGQGPAQKPFAIVLGCSDARAPTELIFDQSINELFIVRVAGNVLGTECLGSVDYAVRHLASELRLIVVMGHTGCGAVGAAVALYLAPDSYGSIAVSYALRSLVDRILVVVRVADRALERRVGPGAPAEPGYRDAIQQMAVYLNAALTAHDLARELDLLAGEKPIRVVSGVYDIASHRVEALPGDDRAFLPAPRDSRELAALADRLAESVVRTGLLRPLQA